jgi:chromosome segregation ATPase
MRPIKLSLALLLAAALTLPALAAKKDKTKGLPPANSSNVPDVDDKPMKDAKIKLAQAQGKLERAQDAMTKTLADLKKESETAPAFAQAQATLRQAQADYDAAATPALEKVRASREYQSALDAKKAAAQKVTDLQADNATEQDQITQAARVVLEKGKAVTDLETRALAADTNIASLKAKLDAANVQLLRVRHDLDQSIKTNPRLASAKADVDQAQSEIPPLQTAYNSELEKYNTAQAAHDKAMRDAQTNRPRYTPGDGGNPKMKKKV